MQVRLLLLLPLAIVFLTLHSLPFLPRPTRLFGLVVPAEVRSGPEARRMLRGFQLRLAPWTLAALICSLYLPLTWSTIWVVCAAILPLIAAYFAFSQMRGQAHRFAVPTSSIRSVELKQTDGEPGYEKWFFAVPLMSLFLCGLYLFARWDDIPERFPVHWNGSMIADGWSNRSVPGVFGPLAIGLIVISFLVTQTRINSASSRKSARHPAVTAIIVAASWVMGASFSMVALLPLHAFPPRQIFEVDLGCLLLAGGLVFFSIPRNSPSEATVEPTPDECWHGDLFYCNPHDPALLVEKRIGVGMTFNFGNRLAWVMLPLIVLFPLVMALLALRLTAR